jgi:type III restriction enzyme
VRNWCHRQRHRQALEGWRGDKVQTLETEGEMIQRVMGDLMGQKNIVVLNDEAHHCYRERVKDAVGDTEDDLKGDDKSEAKENNEAARMWISGLEAVKRKLGISLVYDLSATPFFLRGSGYIEGTLFPWTMSDFSLMDAIECGIVKLPRVPMADNIPGGDTPKFRNLWEHIGKKLPKKGRVAGKALDPLSLACRIADRTWRPSTGTTRRPSIFGRKRGSASRRCSSSSATTRRHRN